MGGSTDMGNVSFVVPTIHFVNPPRSALGAFLGSSPSRVEMSEIGELISELNASAQIEYTSFRTYSKSSAPSSGCVRYRKTPIRGVRYLKTPAHLLTANLPMIYRFLGPPAVALAPLRRAFADPFSLRGVRQTLLAAPPSRCV